MSAKKMFYSEVETWNDNVGFHPIKVSWAPDCSEPEEGYVPTVKHRLFSLLLCRTFIFYFQSISCSVWATVWSLGCHLDKVTVTAGDCGFACLYKSNNQHFAVIAWRQSILPFYRSLKTILVLLNVKCFRINYKNCALSLTTVRL